MAGVRIFLISLLHHFLNLGWHRSLIRGRYSPLRAMQTLLALLLGAAMLLAGWGVLAFGRRSIGACLLLKSHFVFFDFEEPLAFFSRIISR